MSKEKKKSFAITYMLFREERLADFLFNEKSLSYKVLKEYYIYYCAKSDLTEKQINHIINLEKSSYNNAKLSFKNLSTCYAYKHILDRTLVHLRKKNKEGGIKFITSLRDYLLNNCTLSKKQIDGFESWKQYLPKDLREAKLKDFE